MKKNSASVPITRSYLSRNLGSILISVGAFAVFVILNVIAPYLFNFGGFPLSKDPALWGPFGDYVGGALNPMLSFLALIAILLTLHVQNEELNLSRKELEQSRSALQQQAAATDQQNFEGMLFQMIRLHHDIVEKMSITQRFRQSSSTIVHKTREVFSYIWNNEFRSIVEDANKNHLPGQDIVQVFRSHYSAVYGNEHIGPVVGHYFRNLYRIFKYIDESKIEDKCGYSGIVRAQLSTKELLCLFANGLSEQGNGFKKYIETYALFENIEQGVLIWPQLIVLYDLKAFGDQHDFYAEMIENA